MTKDREPISVEATLRLVLAELTLDSAAELTGRSTHYLHALTDPDKRELLSARDLVTLDAAHNARFGRGWLLYQTLGLLLETSGPYTDAIVLARHVVDVARESGEGTAALAEAVLFAGCPERIDRALVELEQGAAAKQAAIASLRALKIRARDGPQGQAP